MYTTWSFADHCLAATGNLKWTQKFTIFNAKPGFHDLNERVVQDPVPEIIQKLEIPPLVEQNICLLEILGFFTESRKIWGWQGTWQESPRPTSLTQSKVFHCSLLRTEWTHILSNSEETLPPPWTACSNVWLCLQQKAFLKFKFPVVGYLHSEFRTVSVWLLPFYVIKSLLSQLRDRQHVQHDGGRQPASWDEHWGNASVRHTLGNGCCGLAQELQKGSWFVLCCVCGSFYLEGWEEVAGRSKLGLINVYICLVHYKATRPSNHIITVLGQLCGELCKNRNSMT